MSTAAWAASGLLAIRLFGIFAVQPHWRRVVGPWWSAVAVALAVSLAPALLPRGAWLSSADGGTWIGLALLELMLGGVVGLLVALPGYALIGALDVSGRSLGLHEASSRVTTGLGLAVVLGLGLSLGLHRPLLVGLSSTLDAWPVGRPSAWLWSAPDLLGRAITAARGVLVLALALATPVLLTLAVVDLGTRLLGRGPAPAEAMMDALRPWLRTAAALIALGASWSAYPEAWARGLG